MANDRREQFDLSMIQEDPRSYLYTYYTEIGHNEAVEDLVALLSEKMVRRQACILALQDWASVNLSEEQYYEVVERLCIM